MAKNKKASTGNDAREIMDAIYQIVDAVGAEREERALRIYTRPTPEERAEVWDIVEANGYSRSREILWDGRLGRDPDDPREYLVTWKVEVFAASKLAAAQEAFVIQRDPNSTATCFEVEGSNPDDIYTFDLVDSQPNSPVPASMIEALAHKDAEIAALNELIRELREGMRPQLTVINNVQPIHSNETTPVDAFFRPLTELERAIEIRPANDGEGHNELGGLSNQEWPVVLTNSELEEISHGLDSLIVSNENYLDDIDDPGERRGMVERIATAKSLLIKLGDLSAESHKTTNLERAIEVKPTNDVLNYDAKSVKQ